MLTALLMNAAAVAPGAGDYAPLATGGLGLCPPPRALAATADDFVAVAERFVGVPHLWVGVRRSASTVRASCRRRSSSGVAAPRDTDMQEAGWRAGRAGLDLQRLRRGDPIFWKGHVGIMRDAVRLLHANAHHMQVSEPSPRRSRIAPGWAA